MIEAGIRNGSRVLIRQCSAEPANGEIVAVLVEGKAGEEATLKRFYREPDHVRLEPANASHPYLILVETPALVGKVRRQYRQQHPEREPDIRSAQRAQIVGWYVGTV
jgi:repressor LexA